jgi:formate/nitrite transporter FocA (FNT family)
MTDPTRRDRTRPLELLGISAGLALAIGVIAYFATRDLLAAGIFFAVAFIVIVVVFAMLLLAVTPRRHDDDAQPPSDH